MYSELEASALLGAFIFSTWRFIIRGMRRALIMGMAVFIFPGSAKRTIAWDYLNEDVINGLSSWWWGAEHEFELSEKTNNLKLKTAYQTQSLASFLAACLVGDRIYEIRTTPRFMEACGKIAAFAEGLPDEQRKEVRLRAQRRASGQVSRYFPGLGRELLPETKYEED
jgi:hypothetical protein